MGMVKMKYINVYGPDTDPQEAFEVLAKLGCFHPDKSVSQTMQKSAKASENIYAPAFEKTRGLLEDLNVGTEFEPYKGAYYKLNDVEEYIEGFAGEVADRNARITEIENLLGVYAQTRTQLYHLTGLQTSVDEIFDVKFLKVRFGRLPKDSYIKLDYYADKQFNFTSYDFDGEYYWGVYFTPVEFADEADAIFANLYFERIRVPEFVHGTPQEGLAMIMAKEGELKAELDILKDMSTVANEKEIAEIRRQASWLNYSVQIFEMNKYAIILDSSFFICGFIPEDKFDDVVNGMKILDQVKVSEEEHEVSASEIPVKLKNNWFSRPFEMFVSMYGLPSYGDFDPTNFVAITYAILFGVMFGDVGQGILLGLLGYFVMYKKMKTDLGLIIARCSGFSVIFGCIYGSFFGYEEELVPLYNMIGLSGPPIHIMHSINLILIASVGCGVVIVTVAMLLGIYSKIRRKEYASAFTSVSGVAGLVFYVSVLVTALKLLLGLEIAFVGTIPYYILFLVVPFIVMYFAEPLNHLIEKKPIHETVGEIMINGFFEMFDALLTYASNTISFLRIGGFVLAHTGMMTVVFTLANMAKPFSLTYWITVVLGNLFVMAMEALFVGIQVLRLEFYEIFSRCFETVGTAYEPLTVELSSKKDK